MMAVENKSRVIDLAAYRQSSEMSAVGEGRLARLEPAFKKVCELQSLLSGFEDLQLRALVLRYAIENARGPES